MSTLAQPAATASAKAPAKSVKFSNSVQVQDIPSNEENRLNSLHMQIEEAAAEEAAAPKFSCGIDPFSKPIDVAPKGPLTTPSRFESTILSSPQIGAKRFGNTVYVPTEIKNAGNNVKIPESDLAPLASKFQSTSIADPNYSTTEGPDRTFTKKTETTTDEHGRPVTKTTTTTSTRTGDPDHIPTFGGLSDPFEKDSSFIDSNKWFEDVRKNMFQPRESESNGDSAMTSSFGSSRPAFPSSFSSNMPSFSNIENSPFERPFDDIKRTNLNPSPRNTVSQQNQNIVDGKFQVVIPVDNFAPHEIDIRLHQKENEIEVVAKHDSKDDRQGTVSRQFSRRYALPVGAVTDELDSYFLNNILTIECPIEEEHKHRMPVRVPISRH